MKKKLFAALIISIFLIQTTTIVLTYAASQSNIDKIVYVHYANNSKAKPQPPPSGGGSYKLMGIKWSTSALPVQFAINYDGSNLDENLVKSTILLASNEWDDGTYSKSKGLTWSGTTANLFADYSDSSVPTTPVKLATNDGVNVIFWGDLGNSGTIAMTTVWYNRFTRLIVEFDMEFNIQYAWSADPNGVTSKMDLQNIATHELGHSVGLADLYKPNTTQETMYGYSNYAVTTARDLYFGDQAGITTLYG